MPSAVEQLTQFIRREMRMSHIYQPLMIKTLLENGGEAATRQIAAAFLAHDETKGQLESAFTDLVSRLVPKSEYIARSRSLRWN